MKAPEGSAAAAAQQAVISAMPLQLGDLFPLNMVVVLRAQDVLASGSQICTAGVAQFSEELFARANAKKFHIVGIGGCAISKGKPLAGVGRPAAFYLSDDGMATLVVVTLSHSTSVPQIYKAANKLCSEFTQPGLPLDGFSCSVAGEWLYGKTSMDTSVVGFATSDAVGVPLALLALCYSQGARAMLVMLTLPVTLLVCFDLNYQLLVAYPHDYQVAPFTPSLMVSMSVAMSLDYTLFIVKSFRDATDTGLKRTDAIWNSLLSSGRTVLISGAILVAANMGGAVNDSIVARSFCWSNAMTAAVVTSVNVTLLPALLWFFEPCCAWLSQRRCRWRRRRTTLVDAGAEMQQRLTDPPTAVEPEALTSQGPVCESCTSEGDTVRVWQASNGGGALWLLLAKVVSARPVMVILVVVAAGLPICLQALRLKYTASLSDLVPDHCAAKSTMKAVGVDFALGITDVKRFLVRPRDEAKLRSRRLAPEDCIDEDATIGKFAEQAGHPGLTSCWGAVVALGCDFEVPGLPTEHPVFLQDLCPSSCPEACTPASVLSRPFLSYLADVTKAMHAASRGFAEASGPSTSGQPIRQLWIESPASLDNRPVSFQQAKAYLGGLDTLAYPDSCDAGSCAERFAQQLQGLASYSRSSTLVNGIIDYDPFSTRGFEWVRAMYEALAPGASVATDWGTVVANDTFGDYEIFFGDPTMNSMQAAVDAILEKMPPNLAAVVIVTVMCASLIAFRSVLIGPRLLITVVFTTSFTIGLCVIIFEDLCGKPLHWIVLLVAVPLMLGLTLDYDIFLLSRCYELRLEGCSTEEAVTRALQQTGPVITTAGVLMILAFCMLMFTGIPTLYELSATLVVCSFMDAFVVRPLLVPAMMLTLVDYNWWPGKMPSVEREASRFRQDDYLPDNYSRA